jgi:hypothetical protein
MTEQAHEERLIVVRIFMDWVRFFYECLTGKPPFRATNVADTLYRVQYEVPVSPYSLEPLGTN